MRNLIGTQFLRGAAVLAPLLAMTSSAGAQKPAAAGSLVVQSTGPTAGRYRPGTRLQEPYTISLKQGDRLLLLGPGGSRVLTGPGTFSSARTPPAANPAYRQQLAGLFQQSSERRARIGGSRRFTIGQLARSGGGAEEGIRPENLWLVDPVASQTWCVEKGRGWTLLLPAGFTGSELVVDNPAGKRLTLARGTQGTVEVSSPDFLSDGRYSLMPTGQPTYTVELKFIEPSSDVLELARQMLERGCDDQLQGLERIAQSG